MQMTTMTKRVTLLAGLVLGGALACSSDPTVAPGDTPLSASARNGALGGDSSSGAATLAISPRTITMTVGASGTLVAVDPNGNIVTGRATWRSSNTAIAVASDSGVVTGKSAGTAVVYATLGGYTDSATVAVVGGTAP